MILKYNQMNLKIVFTLYRYDEFLEDASKYGVKKGFSIGLGMGFFQTVIFSNYSLALW